MAGDGDPTEGRCFSKNFMVERKGTMTANLKKRIALLTAGICFLAGCGIPGIVVSRKDAPADNKPTVEYRLGTTVEMADWVALKKRVCGDLGYATEDLPADVRQKIFKYACVENNKYALGETLEALQPGQIDKMCSRLTEKGYVAKNEKTLTRAEELAGNFAVPILIIIILPK